MPSFRPLTCVLIVALRCAGNLARAVGADAIEKVFLPIYVNVFVIGFEGHSWLGEQEALLLAGAHSYVLCRRQSD